MTYFQCDDYRDIIKIYISQLPKEGRGELTKIAQALGVNSTLVSQVMSGLRDFTFEQCYQLCEYMTLTEIETEYFLLLLQKSRAGTVKLKEFFGKKITALQSESRKLEKRYEHDRKLTDAERSIFYSTWLYSAIRLFASTKKNGVTVNEIEDKFPIGRIRITEIVRFLVQCGLCSEKNGHFTMSVQNTFLENRSPHFLKHHSNWRVKAIQKSDSLTDEEMMFTSPMSISQEDFRILREQLAVFLKQASKRIKDSPSEAVACLNIDFFWI